MLATLISVAISLAAAPVELVIDRNMTCGDEAVMGRLLINGVEVARTLELPWRDNASNVSQIPPGTYRTRMRSDGARGWRIQLDGVPGRSAIQIHTGNDQSHTHGCILVGRAISGCAVVASRSAMEEINERIRSLARGDSSTRQIGVVVHVRQ